MLALGLTLCTSLYIMEVVTCQKNFSPKSWALYGKVRLCLKDKNTTLLGKSLASLMLLNLEILSIFIDTIIHFTFISISVVLLKLLLVAVSAIHLMKKCFYQI